MPSVTRDYQLRFVDKPAEWESHINALCQPHLMQAWSYGQAKKDAANWHVDRFVVEKAGAPVAIFQVLEKRVAGLRAVARINRGPMFTDESPDFDRKLAVYGLLRRRWRFHSGGPLLIAPALPPSAESQAVLRQAGFRQWSADGWCSARINLGNNESMLMTQLAPKWRNQLKKSQQAGLELSISNAAPEVEWMLDMHVRNMNEIKFSGPSQDLIRSLYNARPQDFTALHAVLDRAPVAGLIIVRVGVVAEAYIGWFGAAEARRANCGNFLYWNALVAMKRAGASWFDVGGYHTSNGFGHFKRNMGGMEYKLAGEWWSL